MLYKNINLAAALDYLELILGQDWLETNLKVMKDGQNGQGGFGRNIDYDALGIPHVAKMWYKAREETIDLEIIGGGLPGLYSLSAAAVASDLEVLKDCAGLQTMLDELKDAKLSLPTVYLLAIASGYAQIGYNIDFTIPIRLDRPSSVGSAAQQRVAGGFMARGCGVFQKMILCADIDLIVGSMGKLQIPKIDEEETLYKGAIYLHVGDTLTEAEKLLQGWSEQPEIKQMTRYFPGTVLVYTTGIISINHQLAYMRRGRLVNDDDASFVSGIYIPDEIITTLP